MYKYELLHQKMTKQKRKKNIIKYWVLWSNPESISSTSHVIVYIKIQLN